MKNLLVVIAGPTAIGKTHTAIRLAKSLCSEIVSADSRQFYKEMPIGTAAPTAFELSEAKHHFVGHLSVSDKYDVYRYSQDAVNCISQLHKKNKYVILCGGSGLFIKSVLDGIDFLPDPPAELRASLKTQLEQEGKESLLNKLMLLDPDICKTIDTQNPARLLRALEICITTGSKYSELRNKTRILRDFTPLFIGLNFDREKLYKRIDERTKSMLSNGLIEEVRGLSPYRHLQPLNTVGYKEIFEMLDGKINESEACRQIQANTRKYARKQLTWFRAQKNIEWFEPEDFSSILNKISNT